LREYLTARRELLNVGYAFSLALASKQVTLLEANFVLAMVALDISLLPIPQCAEAQELHWLTVQSLHVASMYQSCIVEQNHDCELVVTSYFNKIVPRRDALLDQFYALTGLDEEALKDAWPQAPVYQALRGVLESRGVSLAPQPVVPAVPQGEAA